jgi:hypothetical protein
MEYSTTDMDVLVKQANVLGRLARGVGGALTGSGKGMLIGGAAGALAAPITGAGLAAALGVGGAGMFSGAMLGGALRGTVGGIRGLLRNPGSRHIASRGQPAASMYRAGMTLPALGVGAGAGYMLSDDDNKMMGSAIGATAGLIARPTIVKALAKRAGG